MSRFCLPAGLRRFSLFSAFLLSLVLHLLFFGGLAGGMLVWLTPEPEMRIPDPIPIEARLASRSPGKQETPVAPPRKKPQPKKPETIKPAEELPPPEPEETRQTVEVKNADEVNEVGEVSEADTPSAEGEDEGLGWPDIPGQLEAIQDFLDGKSGEQESWGGGYSLSDGQRFPWKGELDYRVYRGEKMLEIGVARFAWELYSSHYRVSTVMETSGLISLLRQVRVETESVGVISGSGFYPLRYQSQRDGKITETTLFDWSRHSLRIEGRRGKDLPLRRESQDLMSLQGQLPFWIIQEEQVITPEAVEVGAERKPESAPVPGRLALKWQEKEVWVATGKGYEAVRIVMVGEEIIELADRALTTLHFRVSGKTETEFWLAKEFYWLPVQIRHRDRHDDLYEQRLQNYHFFSDPEKPESGAS